MQQLSQGRLGKILRLQSPLCTGFLCHYGFLRSLLDFPTCKQSLYTGRGSKLGIGGIVLHL